ncbi:Membrane dipeptidase [Sphingomonas aurantiaca]|uniref:Membrane dipeptidase n=1 Tax=Sphingomonas aurantiaca TaxID=185949 RepID=A0A5E7Y1E4_9SPHN|nr:dipeptidase [Sphingomonas aurantiaca]VVT00590.1 Membrane dipeptidase [Sphingomonas aurantiaca]
MIAAFLLMAAQASPDAAQDPRISRRVDRVLARSPVIDGHNDLAWEIRELHDAKVEAVDLSVDTAQLPNPLQTDIPRLHKGHVGGQFWSVYIPAEAMGARAVEMTLEEIDIVRRFVAANPATFELATTAADIRRIEKAERIASLIGVEGGHQIDGRLSVLRQYRALGVAYMTLTHGKSLNWADSATDAPRANGLSDFGRQVIAEMNRIGMIVDVSHVSDATMTAALAATKAPVIASHSSARAIADAPRNIPDDLLRAIGANGGVVMVNFYPSFLSGAWRGWDGARTAYAKSIGVPAGVYGSKSPAPLVAWDAAHPEPHVTAATVADHVEHIAQIAGHDHVGIGGDFDGIQGTGPIGLKGVDGYPLLFAELARRGWSDGDLAKLSGGNVLRVMEAVEGVAKAMAGLPPVDATDVASR